MLSLLLSPGRPAVQFIETMYPVDLPSVDNSDLTSASLEYLTCLEKTTCNEWFQLSANSKVAVTADNIKQLQVFGDGQPDCILLALYKPDEPTRVVALFLHKKWWHVDDVLITSSKRNGLKMVQSTVERVLVLTLSQLVDRPIGEELLFLNHPQTESCKLLWTRGEAVGFYSFKLKGSLCERCITQCYCLPVLDTIFVRSHCRRRGFGLLMLEDFCSMFPSEEVLGISSPISAGMAAVCRKFLLQHKQHRDVLYEVEAPGGWAQRRNIWLSIQLGRYPQPLNKATSGKTMKNVEGSSSEDKLCILSPGETSLNSTFFQSEETGCGQLSATSESSKTEQDLNHKARVDFKRKEVKKTNKGKRLRIT